MIISCILSNFSVYLWLLFMFQIKTDSNELRTFEQFECDAKFMLLLYRQCANLILGIIELLRKLNFWPVCFDSS